MRRVVDFVPPNSPSVDRATRGNITEGIQAAKLTSPSVVRLPVKAYQWHQVHSALKSSEAGRGTVISCPGHGLARDSGQDSGPQASLLLLSDNYVSDPRPEAV